MSSNGETRNVVKGRRLKCCKMEKQGEARNVRIDRSQTFQNREKAEMS